MTGAHRHGEFARRHIGTDAVAQGRMLDVLGYESVDALVSRAVPASIQVEPLLGSVIPEAATEAEALAELRTLAAQNRPARAMIGLGYYDTITPSVIARNVLENPSWYTAYTPYQPEISQGRLEALLNFQTMVQGLTGLQTAGASMLDESTAVVEGMLLARRSSKSRSNVFLVDADALPQTKALLVHRAEALGILLVEVHFAARELALPARELAQERAADARSLSEARRAETKRRNFQRPSARSSSTPALRVACGTRARSSRPSTRRAGSWWSPPTCWR